MLRKYSKIGCIADLTSEDASQAHKILIEKYKLFDANNSDQEYDVILALGGDGLMLKVLHRFIKTDIPIYGMNRGSVGFLMNSYREDNLIERLEKAIEFKLFPLEVKTVSIDGEKKSALAINEVSLIRQTSQAAKIQISINNEIRLDTLVCDGIIVSTPAGSTAYNLAANGPIVPLNSNILPITPICPFRPRRWKGALLSSNDIIKLDILYPKKRPVSAAADFIEIRDVTSVDVRERKDIPMRILFDEESSIAERLIKEQFMP